MGEAAGRRGCEGRPAPATVAVLQDPPPGVASRLDVAGSADPVPWPRPHHRTNIARCAMGE
eukprot:3857662-Lingulodinium_polyedra.AAC.1